MTANLLSRLQGLTAPDREVDFWLSIRFPVDEPTRHTDEELQADIDLVGIDNMVVDAPYTASLDAAVALCERVLPGYDWIVGHTNGGLTIHAQVGQNEMVFGETPAIALLIAILSALETRDARD